MNIIHFKRTVLTAGFAMFSMFFGSGNLVFPLTEGVLAMDQPAWATVGILLTGVLVPFLGLIGVILYDGNRVNYFACIGEKPAFFLTFVMLALMGPFGVIARCITVAHGGVSLIWPGLPLSVFSLIFCVITALLVWNHNRIIPIMGRILTPFLLGGIGLITVFGLLFNDTEALHSDVTSLDVFLHSLVEGYQMMDLLAAFFFSATTVAYLRGHVRSDERPGTLIKLSLAASVIGASLLAIIYIGFIALGSKYSAYLDATEPQTLLAAIAGFCLGEAAIPVTALTIALACLTTATILVMLFADFLNHDMSKGKIGAHKSTVITLVIAFIVSLMGFSQIRVFLGTILTIAYPALIALTAFNIMHKLFKVNLSKYAFWLTLGITLAEHFLR